MSEWIKMFLGIGATFLRVFVSLLLAFLWTIPIGVLIGTKRKKEKIIIFNNIHDNYNIKQ